MPIEGLQPLTLYDFRTAKGGECVSPRTWRLRLTLNYKELPYRTEWLELSDVKAKGQEIGAPPTVKNPDGSGSMLWTIPMLVDPNHLDGHGKPTVLSNSTPIVVYLDKMYPDKEVIPEGTAALMGAWEQLVEDYFIKPIWRLIVPLTPQILPPASRDYFTETRQKWWGPLDKICPDRQTGMKEAKEAFNKIAAILDSYGGVPRERKEWTVMPGKITYADFLLVAPLLWANAVLGEEEMAEIKDWNDGKGSTILNNLKERGLLRVD